MHVKMFTIRDIFAILVLSLIAETINIRFFRQRTEYADFLNI